MGKLTSGKEHKPGVERWNAIAESWHKWIPQMHSWYEPATELMLDLARIKVGEKVLDIAAGDGDQSLTTAERVGPSGHVLAIDNADKLLAIAEQSARGAELSNIETRLMDGENLELPDASFDAVICRFALMFFENPIQGLQGVRRVLKPKGRLSVVVYAENGDPEFLTAITTVRNFMGIKEHAKPAATSLGKTEVLEQTLIEGGFAEVEVHPLMIHVRMTSAAECVNYLQDTSPTLKEMLLPVSSEARKEAWQAVKEALSKYKNSSGFEVQHRVMVAAGSAK